MLARRLCFAALMLLLILPACSRRREAVIVSHPKWEYQDYTRLAVLSFEVPASEPEAAGAAQRAENALVDLLTRNGTFQVASRSDLAAIMTEQDLARLAGVADAATAMPEGMIQVAQAVVIGRITDYELVRDQKEMRLPIYAVDSQGRVIRDRAGRPVQSGEDVRVQYRHLARLGASVRVLDVATGRVLVSYSVPPIEKDDTQWNRPPDESPEQLAEEVAAEIAAAFYKQIAPIEVEVKLDSDSLIVATDYYEGEYHETDKVPSNVPELLVVAREMPSEADRNEFRIAISPKDARGYLAEHQFVWSPSLGQRGEVMRVPVTTLRESGHQEFTAKLFSAGSEVPMIERDFRLVEPRIE